MDDQMEARLQSLLDEQAELPPPWHAAAAASWRHLCFPAEFLRLIHGVVLPVFDEFSLRTRRGGWRAHVVSTERSSEHLEVPDGFHPGDTALFFSRLDGLVWRPACDDYSFSIHGDRAAASAFALARTGATSPVRTPVALAELNEVWVSRQVIAVFETLCGDVRTASAPEQRLDA